MEFFKLKDMILGWFCGNFSPTVYKTGAFEAAVKYYKKGDADVVHYHKVATEITVVVKGSVTINGAPYTEGDIILIKSGERSDFRVVEDAATVVIKIPGVMNDKYTD